MRITSHDYDVTNMCLDARLFPHRQRCSWRHARIMILVPGVILNMHISVCFERIDKTLHRRQKEESDKIVVKCYNEYFVNASLCNYLCTRMLQQTRVSRITDIGKRIGISDVGNPISYVWKCQVDTHTTHILRRIKKYVGSVNGSLALSIKHQAHSKEYQVMDKNVQFSGKPTFLAIKLSVNP